MGVKVQQCHTYLTLYVAESFVWRPTVGYDVDITCIRNKSVFYISVTLGTLTFKFPIHSVYDDVTVLDVARPCRDP